MNNFFFSILFIDREIDSDYRGIIPGVNYSGVYSVITKRKHRDYSQKRFVIYVQLARGVRIRLVHCNHRTFDHLLHLCTSCSRHNRSVVSSASYYFKLFILNIISTNSPSIPSRSVCSDEPRHNLCPSEWRHNSGTLDIPADTLGHCSTRSDTPNNLPQLS